MDEKVYRIMAEEVVVQCRYALGGANLAEQALDERKEMWRFWLAMQIIVTSVANISKILWGAGGRKSEERRRLREALGVPDDSPLRCTKMRNNFEHIDERIEQWRAESTTGNFLDRNFGHTEHPGIGGAGAKLLKLDPLDIFRNYNPVTGELVFWGHIFDYPGIVAAVDSVFPLAEEEANPWHKEMRAREAQFRARFQRWPFDGSTMGSGQEQTPG